MIADEREKARAALTQLKLALVTADPKTFLPLLFGDQMSDTTATAPPKPVEPDFDPAGDTAGEWKFTQAVDPAEAERIMAELLGDTRGTVTTSADGEWH